MTEYWVNVTKDDEPSIDILWNNQQLDWMMESESGLITKYGQNEHILSYYDNLPKYIRQLLPLPGTNEIASGDGDTLYLPKSTLVYMVKEKYSGNADVDGWTYTGDEGYYLGQNNTAEFMIYRRIMKTGVHRLYNPEALYLFVEGKASVS